MMLFALSILQSVKPGDEAAAGVALIGLFCLGLAFFLILIGWNKGGD